MDLEHPPETVPATPEDILKVFQDWHRHECEYDPEMDPSVKLTFDSTVAEWREACDLLPWRPLAKALDQRFKLGLPLERWREVLEPAKQRKLKDVCTFIAENGAQVSRIRPARLLGGVCESAGAFLTIKSLLHEAGADVSNLSPSAELHEYTRRYAGLFVTTISELAPGKLPAVRYNNRAYDKCVLGSGIGLLLILVGGVLELLRSDNILVEWLSILLLLGGAMVFAAAYAGCWITAKCMLPTSVEFGQLRTFGDLARLLAEPQEQADS